MAAWWAGRRAGHRSQLPTIYAGAVRRLTRELFEAPVSIAYTWTPTGRAPNVALRLRLASGQSLRLRLSCAFLHPDSHRQGTKHGVA
eukprot:5537916-Alexandrium_andersonii.AAC.1